jgi:hypothetical protein
MKEFCLAVDAGKRRDRGIFFVLKDTPTIVDGSKLLKTSDRIVHYYDPVFIDQFFREDYTTFVSNLCRLAGTAELTNNSDLLVDGQGVGEPVVDMMRKSHLYPIPILATSGDRVKEVYEEVGNIFKDSPGQLQGVHVLKEIHVPKKDLVEAGALILQQRRLRIPKSLKLGDDFDEQLQDFIGIQSKKIGKKKYEAEDEDVHDDIVFCFLMAAWWFTRRTGDDTIREQPISGSGQRTGDWNPYDHL